MSGRALGHEECSQRKPEAGPASVFPGVPRALPGVCSVLATPLPLDDAQPMRLPGVGQEPPTP